VNVDKKMTNETKKKGFLSRTSGKVTLALVLLVSAGAGFGITSFSQNEQYYTGTFDSKKAHHGKGRFVNLNRTGGPPSIRLSSIPKLVRLMQASAKQAKHPAPSVSKAYLQKKLYLKNNSVTWLGHAAFQVRLKEANILLDPMLGNRASPFSFAGPARFQKPGLTVKQIGKVDMIFISHNHYDHYDNDSLRSFPNRDNIDIVVPLGMKTHLKTLGYRKIHEMDWWDSKVIRGIRVVCYPVQHFSGRGLRDRYKSLWSGWGLFPKGLRLYFGGDTGYFKGFKEVGKKDGPFDLAFMPIGAYAPREMMQFIHMNPEEAVQASKDLRARRVVGMHYGTCPLTSEPPREPPRRFRKAMKKAGYSQKQTWIMKVGETRFLKRTSTRPTPALPTKAVDSSKKKGANTDTAVPAKPAPAKPAPVRSAPKNR
jgi:L-ascorbate metabolism protein UlaG (beta-lactamase superfamily)